jgi:hypothetical protein
MLRFLNIFAEWGGQLKRKKRTRLGDDVGLDVVDARLARHAVDVERAHAHRVHVDVGLGDGGAVAPDAETGVDVKNTIFWRFSTIFGAKN